MKNAGKPMKRFRAGSVTATVWKNTGEKNGQKIEYFTVSLARSYKDGNEWKNTGSLRMQDVSDAGLVINKANEFLRLKDVGMQNGNDFVAASEI